MRLVKLFFISSIFLCVKGINLHAQKPATGTKPDPYRAINWTIEDGLSSEGDRMLKDVHGFLWFGPYRDNLCRFDGARFETFRPNSNKPGTIYSGGINSLKEDSLHNIWIGTDKGLSRYDIKADTFTNFITVADSGISDKSSVPFWSTKNEVYCLESSFRIVVYNIHTFQKKNLLALSEEERQALGPVLCAIFDSNTNNIWMLEGGNLDREHPGGGLIQISLNDGKRLHYGWTCLRNIPNHDHYSEEMQLDHRRNSIWINSPDGLLEFSLTDKSFHFCEAFRELIKLKDYNRFVGLEIDWSGKIWLATDPKGVLIYDPDTKKIKPLFSDSVLQKNTGEHNFDIYCDRDGIVWLSYWDKRGIYELLPYNPSVSLYAAKYPAKDSLSDPRISTIVPAGRGKLFIGTATRMNIFDQGNGKFELLKEEDMSGIKGDFFTPMFIDTIRQKAWLYAYPNNQAYEMNIQTRICRPIQFMNGSKKIDTLNLEAILAQPYKGGLLLYDMNYGFFEIKKDSLVAELVIPRKDFVGRIVLVDDRWLFLKNPNFPPNYTYKNSNGKWAKTPHLLDTLDWNSIFYDKKDQTSWVSADEELIHYDNNFRKIRTYSRKEGYNGSLANMLTDNMGNLWYANFNKQIGRLNIITGIISNLSAMDGYQPQFFDWFTAAAKDIQGNLYFAESSLGTGRKGFIRINPEKYLSSKLSFVYFSNLAINYKPFPLPAGINSLDELDLKYNQNSISIETGIIDYYSKGGSHIRYKMEGEGKNEEWQYGSAYYTIRYDGLTPGKYKLILQASNAGNEFNGPAKILLINIKAPWWQTWWARSLFILFFALSLWSFIQYRSRNLKQRNIELEDKVMHRTRELKHSLEDLRATQTQLVQREKMASLGELTAGIAHEIQNPLNFVNNFSDLNSELIDEMKQEVESGNLTAGLHVADIIKENNLKINNHGRRADSIVKGMLLHSRQSSGQREPTNINSLADEYLRLSYHGLRAKDKSFNATLQTDFDDQIGLINIVPQDIGRVFLNLFNNSFYAVSEKRKMQIPGYEPTVYISTRKSGQQVEIKIRDNGSGIPQKLLEKIFQPFFTTKPTGEGTGLGLSLSYEIITKGHRGTIDIDTKEGEHTEFIIRLPIIN